MSTGTAGPDAAAVETLQTWIDRYRQVPLGDETWAYASFADLVARHGQSYEPAPWLMDEPQKPGQCFAASRRRAEEAGWTYVEGFVLVPSVVPFICFEHAWCLTPEGLVVDPAVADGLATAYVGVPLTDRFCSEQRELRQTDAVLAFDPLSPLAGANTLILRDGLPPYALASMERRQRSM